MLHINPTARIINPAPAAPVHTVTHLLDSDWIDVVATHLREYPASVALVIEPEILGRYDAEQGNPNQAHYYYRKPADVDAYTQAYDGTAALWAAMVECINADAHDDAKWAAELAWIDAEADDLIDAREDIEFWRTM